jgi:hypothetical protein
MQKFRRGIPLHTCILHHHIITSATFGRIRETREFPYFTPSPNHRYRNHYATLNTRNIMLFTYKSTFQLQPQLNVNQITFKVFQLTVWGVRNSPHTMRKTLYFIFQRS